MRSQDACAVGGGRDDMPRRSHPSVGVKTPRTTVLAAGNVAVGSHG